MGSWERWERPGKNAPLSVNTHAPTYQSATQRSHLLDVPTSDLKPQRFVPVLTNRAGSYWPVGTVTVRLALIEVFSFHLRYCRTFIAGPPRKLTATRTRESAMPER